MYECIWIDTEFDLEVGTYDMIMIFPLPGYTITVNGFEVERVERDDDNECATIYGTW